MFMVIQYPHGDLSYSKGKILNIDKYEITHDASTIAGSSGSPIFLEGTKLVIGIHKEGDKEEKVNYGDLLYPIIKDLEQQYEDKNENIKHEDNIINDNYEEEGKIINKDGSYYIGQKKMEKHMVKENYFIKMEILNMKVILLMVNLKEMENVIGKMVNIILDN